MNMKIESPISSGMIVMAKVTIFQKEIELQGQGHKIKNNGTIWNVFSKGMHIWFWSITYEIWKLYLFWYQKQRLVFQK